MASCIKANTAHVENILLFIFHANNRELKVDDYVRKKLVNRPWNFHGRFLA